MSGRVSRSSSVDTVDQTNASSIASTAPTMSDAHRLPVKDVDRSTIMQ